jgi:hypothetical protein
VDVRVDPTFTRHPDVDVNTTLRHFCVDETSGKMTLGKAQFCAARVTLGPVRLAGIGAIQQEAS